MRMVFRRLTGQVIHEEPWSGISATPAEFREHAKTALFGFYATDDRCFWPKAEHTCAAEEVIILDTEGELIARYTINDIMADTKLTLVGRH
ncbi:hypothetical protein [Methylosinus sp. PW1]|uniref:hypothetical protein n=1 Tax=Methylosinus sp. PW1 TaxID=107636 RepID=UPI0012EC061E|nr:hypothetical protein [Methylosinus sp. PW1]